MSIKLARILRNKLALIGVGILLVAAISTTVVVMVAAHGHQPGASAAQTSSLASHCSSDQHSKGHTSSQADDRGESDQADEHQHSLRGTITSIDTSSSSFVLKQCNGTTTTIEVSGKTVFDESSVRGIADLKVGLFVDVQGTPQSNGHFTARSIQVETSNSGNEHDGHGTGTPTRMSND
jgi:hypothetical protein